jgi:hypothetical protein
MVNNIGVTTANSYSNTSDDRIKHNETPIINSLEILSKLKPLTYIKTRDIYEKNHNFSPEEIQKQDNYFESGFIAQEIRKIDELKHLVHGEEKIKISVENEDEKEIETPLNLDYNGIFTHGIAAIQELYIKYQELDTKYKELEKNRE